MWNYTYYINCIKVGVIIVRSMKNTLLQLYGIWSRALGGGRVLKIKYCASSLFRDASRIRNSKSTRYRLVNNAYGRVRFSRVTYLSRGYRHVILILVFQTQTHNNSSPRYTTDLFKRDACVWPRPKHGACVCCALVRVFFFFRNQNRV